MANHNTSSHGVREVEDAHSSRHGDEQGALARAAHFYLQLSPRQLPSRFLYDALGSALFDAICQLPWYHITRSELQLLRQHSPTIGALLGAEGRIVELGCGNGEKLATLLTHANLERAQTHLIDLSEAALARSIQTLSTIVRPRVAVTAHRATYEDGLLAIADVDAATTLVAFLGSNIGNFDPPGASAFLGAIRAALQPGGYLLLGADLVKSENELQLAYDDPLGLTAAFNRNLLLRLNTELDADFDLDRFAHRAVWNGAESRVEMHLVSLASQHVRVSKAGLRFTLERGETIWTESSYKYQPHDIRRLVEASRFVQRHQWIDQRARFALTLFEAS